jgi:hypothetical protein
MRMLLIGCTLLMACSSSKKREAKMEAIDQFKIIITGDFDNRAQVEAEIKAGRQLHPLARHINRVADEKIINRPEKAKEPKHFYILEESYYDYPGKPTEIKPFLFKFSDAGEGRVQLTVYQLPAGIDKKDIRNDNAALQFDYTQLVPSPTFKGAVYALKDDGCFYTNSANELGNGMRFTLTEKMCRTQLQVMELLEKDGKQLTPYDTPILYDRR